MDHRQFAEMYKKRAMSKLSPRMLKPLKELIEYPFKIQYTPSRG